MNDRAWKAATAVIVLCLSLGLSGCAAALVGGLLYDNAADNTNRTRWTENFGRQNLEREKAGLQPLDWCSEIYKAKKSWATAEQGCAARVKRYEEGDATALNI
jgi:hypothetical protein